MVKKHDSMFKIPPNEAISKPTPNENLIQYKPAHSMTREERRTVDELNKQILVEVGTGAKTVKAMRLATYIHKKGAINFDDAGRYIIGLKTSGEREEEHQAFIDEFCTREMQVLGRHLLGTMEIGVASIVEIVQMPLYLEKEDPEFRSLWERIFG